MSLAPIQPPRAQAANPFAERLRYWRLRRGLSQLGLANEAGSSQRHLSFLESGRTAPSREMVLKLALVLDVPLRERNALLLAAGYAPAYRERELGDPEMREVKRALDYVLDQHEPNPAIVVDRLWNMVMANASAQDVFAWLLEGTPAASAPPTEPPDDARNVIMSMLRADAMRPFIANWDEVAADAIHWIHREAIGEAPDGEARALLARLLALEGVPRDWRVPDFEAARAVPFMPLRIVKNGIELNLFTMITTLGTPHDVTLQELRVESFHAADAATAAWLAGRAREREHGRPARATVR